MADGQNSHGKEEPIIIKKKKGHGGHGHHGGAWKVAYADFVTAMMAFFIVMWIMGQSEEIKKNVVSYFEDPGAFNFVTGKRAVPVDLDFKPSGKGDGDAEKSDGKPQLLWVSGDLQDTLIRKLKEEAFQDSVKAAKQLNEIGKEINDYIKQQMMQKPKLKDILSSIKIEMTKEGLRIELIESSEALFFDVGSSNIRNEAREVLVKLSEEIGLLPNNVELEGHTDSRKYSKGAGYTNWELSTDRANSARRLMETSGLWEGQVYRVTGYSDKKLRKSENPFDVENRRISILIRHMKVDDFMPVGNS